MKCQQISSWTKWGMFSFYTILILGVLLSLAYALPLFQSVSDLLVGEQQLRSKIDNDNSPRDIASSSSSSGVAIQPQRPNLLHYLSSRDSHNVTSTSSTTSTTNTLKTSNESSSNQSSLPCHQSSLPCQRYCPIRINKIYYADNPKGLGDRIIVLRGLSQLAGYLCAEVIMPPPREHLAIDHNFGKPISEEVQWSDFVNITFIQDGSPTIKSANTWKDEAGINITSWSNIPAFNLSTLAKYKDWLHVVSVDGNMRDDFTAIQKFSFEQPHDATIGFVWEIHKGWYSSDLWLERLPVLDQPTTQEQENAVHDYREEMTPYVSSYYRMHRNVTRENRLGCVYTDFDSPPMQLAMMQKRFLGYIVRNSPNNTIFGHLHLRRGDAINDCDTSVETIRQYFACSLENTDTLGRNITLLMTSDDDNVQYRQSIMNLIKDYPHVSILDADEIAWKVVTEAANDGIISKALQNNYYIFEVESILRDRDNTFCKFYLQRRRSHCKRCRKVANRLNKILNY